MKRLIPYLLILALLGGCAATSTPNEQNAPEPSVKTEPYRRVEMNEAIALMEEESGYIILDVRRIDEYSEKHIPGAICVPNETIGTDPIPELPNLDQLIFVYCRSGMRSIDASNKLAALGYTNIVEFGGIIEWPGETVSGIE